MLTPQEIQERTDNLEKAVFGGYSVASVEELLGPLSRDYAALYKENAVLKSKMKVIISRMEAYRKQEEGISKSLLAAQKTADDLVSEAEQKSARMVSDTEVRLRQRKADLETEMAAEVERVNLAKQAAARFIVEIENRVQEQLAALERIKQLDLAVVENRPAAAEKPAEKKTANTGKGAILQRAKAVQAEQIAAEPAKAEAPKAEPKQEPPVDAARQIEENLTRILEEATKQNAAAQEDLSATRVMDPMG